MKTWKAAGPLKSVEGFTGGCKHRAKYAVSRCRTDFWSAGSEGGRQSRKVAALDKTSRLGGGFKVPSDL